MAGEATARVSAYVMSAPPLAVLSWNRQVPSGEDTYGHWLTVSRGQKARNRPKMSVFGGIEQDCCGTPSGMMRPELSLFMLLSCKNNKLNNASRGQPCTSVAKLHRSATRCVALLARLTWRGAGALNRPDRRRTGDTGRILPVDLKCALASAEKPDRLDTINMNGRERPH